jgi:hypothetical protein
LKLKLDNPPLLGLTFHQLPFRRHGRFDHHRFNGANELLNDGFIDAESSEHHTPALTQHNGAAVASVNGLSGVARGVRRIVYRQPTPAAATNEKPDQKGPTAATGLGAVAATIGVGGQLLLVALELRPVAVPLMVLLEEDLAVLQGAVVAIGLAGAPVDDLGAMLALTVGVGARVERVLQDRNDVAIADRRPLEGDHLLAVRRARKVYALGLEGEVDLPSASKQAKSTEDQPRRFLDPGVRIKTQADLAMPDVTDGHRNPQLASPGLRTGRVVHASAQDAELELADAALHAKQEPVIGPTGIIYAVKIDDPGLDEAAEFEKMVPIPAVPGQAGGVETEHGPNVAGTKPCDELLEAWSGHRAAGRTAKVVVDDFDLPKSTSPGLIDKLVLAPLALEVDLHPERSGLADVNDGLPLQERRRKDLTVHHRLPPRSRRRPLPLAGGPGARSPRCALAC